MDGYGLSRRGAANVEAVWPRISKAVAEREQQAERPTDVMDMSTSENWVLRDELIALFKQSVQEDFTSRHLSYPDELAGDSALLSALAVFFNKYFEPRIPVETDHIATAPGAAYALDALLHNICDPDGFDWLLNVRAGVKPVFVPSESLSDTLLASQVIPALEATLGKTSHPIKGVLLTNPNIHWVDATLKKPSTPSSDFLYALSVFDNGEATNPVPFVSVMGMDVEALGGDPSCVHTVWSISKDFGSSGLRMGCIVTQYNKRLRTGIALVSNTQMSSLTAVAATSLLQSPALSRLLQVNSGRLAISYARMTSFLKNRGLEYVAANMGPFLFARLAPHAQSVEDEKRLVETCKECGVSVSTGGSYHVADAVKGWTKLTFALRPEALDVALKRLATALGRFDASQTNTAM
ncbi:PLP-dependent transferase [Xylariaceae sp. FL0594]|nr:PLP-dependent transferase [Xylariaceae sp. FL0594]